MLPKLEKDLDVEDYNESKSTFYRHIQEFKDMDIFKSYLEDFRNNIENIFVRDLPDHEIGNI